MSEPDEAPARLTTALADRYRIERELGHGGMATVYLAEDLKHHRRVAIKVIRPELSAMLGGERFLNEIQVTAQLQHPHVLPLFDSGSAEGLLWYAMPYVEGESLRSRLLREKQLPVDEAVQLAREVATALDYAHRHGVIHRDIKPENILLHDGQALVADFGIALAVSAAGGGRLTETGLSLGTPHYMSPEQAMGERDIGPRSDVYALGCVLYEMLVGEPPFTGPTAQAILAKVVTEEPRPPSAHRKAVPPPVDDAVMVALEKVPADRFASAAEFAQALTSEHRRRATAARRARPGGPDRGPVRRAALAGAVVGAVLTALIGGRTLRVLGGRPTVAAGEERAQLSFTGRAWHPAITPDGEFVAYVERVCEHAADLCRDALLIQEVGNTRPVTLLSKARSIDRLGWTPDGSAIVLSGDLDSAGSGLFTLARLGGAPRRIADRGDFDVHPRGDSVVVAAPAVSRLLLRVISLSTAAPADSLILPAFRGISSVSWSPDGRRLLVASRGVLQTVDRRGGVLDTLAINSRGVVRWTRSGDGVLVFRPGRAREDELARFTVGADGRLARRFTVVLPRTPTLYEGEFDIARRTGRVTLATGDASHDLWAFDIGATGIAARQLTRSTTWYGEPGLAADGSVAFYMRGDALGDNLYRNRLRDGAEEALTAEHQVATQKVSPSPDGRWLTFSAWAEGTDLTLMTFDLQSRRLDRARITFPADAWPLAGHRLLLRNRRFYQWVLLDSLQGAPAPLPLADSLRLFDAAVSPGGDRFALLGNRADTVMLVVGQPGVGPIRRVAVLLPEDREAGLSWSGDADLYLGRWLRTEPTPSVWRVPVAGGAPTRVANLPAPCNPATVAVAAAGRRSVCLVEELRSDIWTVERIAE
jgi:hypothetical protein